MEDYLPHIHITIGLIIIGALAILALKAARSKSWPSASGVILSKGKKVIDSKSSFHGTTNMKSTQVDMEYQYEVDGVKYVSKRATFSDLVNKPISALDNILSQYELEREIVVYYNPKKHSDSVLIPGVRVWNFTPMITGLFFIAGGFFFLYQ